MPNIVSRPCPCGRQVRATDPLPGSILRCVYCGGEQLYDGPATRLSAPESSSATPFPWHGQDESRYEDLSCPGCGGVLRVEYRGPESRDKVAVCPYCDRTVDLPEARSFARERITEKPGSRVEERVVQWEGEVGSAMPAWLLDTLSQAGNADGEVVTLSGEIRHVEAGTYDSRGAYSTSKTTQYRGDGKEILRALEGGLDASSSTGAPSLWKGLKDLFRRR